MATFRVIVLDRQLKAEQAAGAYAPQQWRYVLWADVPVSRQTFYQDATKMSVWKGASASDNGDLQAGRVVERIGIISVRAGATLADVQQQLQNEWTAFQNDITDFNPWLRYGSTWDGTTWVPGGVS